MKDVIHIYLDHVEFKLFMDKDKLHQKEIAVLNSFQERVHYNVTWKRVIETLFLVVLKRMLCISVGCVDNPFYVRYFYASYGEDRFFYYPPCIRNAEDFEDFLQEIALTDNCFYVQT